MGFNSGFKGLIKGRDIPLLHLWAFVYCYRVNFALAFIHGIQGWLEPTAGADNLGEGEVVSHSKIEPRFPGYPARCPVTALTELRNRA